MNNELPLILGLSSIKKTTGSNRSKLLVSMFGGPQIGAFLTPSALAAQESAETERDAARTQLTTLGAKVTSLEQGLKEKEDAIGIVQQQLADEQELCDLLGRAVLEVSVVADKLKEKAPETYAALGKALTGIHLGELDQLLKQRTKEKQSSPSSQKEALREAILEFIDELRARKTPSSGVGDGSSEEAKAATPAFVGTPPETPASNVATPSEAPASEAPKSKKVTSGGGS
jgi:hypothetical protein